jgi:predicted membrane channel-forming protein YqfA (hemolysin III family)
MEGICYIFSNELWKVGMHFLLSCAVGALVYFWTLTILSHRCSGGQNSTGVFSIYQYSFLLALLCSVLSHIVQDYTVRWF